MRTAPLLAASAALIVVAATLGSWADDARDVQRPRGGIASLLGGLSPIVAQASWIRAEAALRDRRDADALYHLDLVTSLEPHLVAARDHVAREIGLTRASEMSEPTDRYSLVKEGLRILDDTVELNPRDAEAYLVRARYLREAIAGDPEVRDLYQAETGVAPIEGVGRDYDSVLEFARDPAVHRDEAGINYVLLGQKRLFVDTDAEGALEALGKADAIYAEAVERFADEPVVRDVKQRTLGMIRALIRVSQAPASERRSLYEEVWQDAGLPPPDILLR